MLLSQVIMRIVDLKLTIDGLILDDDKSVEDFIESLNINSIYDIVYEVLYEEKT